MSLKLAYCLPSLFSYGGMEKVATIKANYLAEHFDYDITIILTDGKDRKPAFDLSPKIKVINLDIDYYKIHHYKNVFRFLAYLYKQIVFKKRLAKVLNEIDPHIIISMLRREINFLTDIKNDCIKIGELHFNRLNYRDFNTRGEGCGIKKIMATMWMNHLISKLKKVEKFVVLSYQDKENWVNDLNNVVVIYNPISKYPIKISDCSSKKVIAVGRYAKQKGFDMLLDSWKIVMQQHSDWTLSIYGEGDRTKYEQIIKKNDLEGNVFLFDACNDLEAKYLESSIFAFTSRFEGFGMAITEAMSCGVPPVAFSCPCGPKDIITNNINGLLVEPQNVEEFAQKLCHLIENESIRKEMGKEARVRSQDFDIKIISEQWNKLFCELVNK